MGPEKGLYDYLQILKSPEVYPDIQGAGFMLSPILNVISNIIAYMGIVAMFFVILRMGSDVLIMAGAGNFMGASDKEGKVRGAFLLNLSSFNSVGDATKVMGDIPLYLKNYGTKIILMLVFIGIMISGQMLPLAGTITATTGTILTRVANINPAPYLETLGLSEDTIGKNIQRANIAKLMSSYGEYTQNLTGVRQRLRNPEELSDEEYNNLAKAYYISYWTADLYATELEGTLHNARIKSRQDGGVAMTNDEKKLMNFDTNAHNVGIDRVLLEKGKEVAGDSDSSGLQKYAEEQRNNLKSAKTNNVLYQGNYKGK